MVKVTFNSSFGQRDLKKGCNAEALIPEERDLEDGMRVRRQSKVCCWYRCLGLALMLSGVVVGGAYLYKTYILERRVYWCGVDYLEQDYMVQDEDVLPSALRHIQESIRVLEEVELINVPVPEFSDSDPADIVHDFKSRLTAYLDLSLNKCYVISLNTSIVMPPKDLLELLINIKAGTYLPQSYLVHEQMMVTERLENVDQLGYFIYSLCKGRDTYKLERRETILGREKREALNCRTIRHFENKFVVETLICDP
ncbi:integral membrane protein 2B-like [Oncorhynchus keta]|uniref:integral membrane protein 2B-like n=1 Tax=Oncorhynchus keta TaxID=8018 RepID=UPI0015FD4BC1|nr:integral membrane protein 2B-like [Oncorhynchus keta]